MLLDQYLRGKDTISGTVDKVYVMGEQIKKKKVRECKEKNEYTKRSKRGNR